MANLRRASRCLGAATAGLACERNIRGVRVQTTRLLFFVIVVSVLGGVLVGGGHSLAAPGDGSVKLPVGGNFPEQMALVDFNKDGHKDLITLNASSGDISILLGDGANGFALKRVLQTPGPDPTRLAAA